MKVFAPWFSALFAVISGMSVVKAAMVRHDPALMHRWVAVAVGMAGLALLLRVQRRRAEERASDPGDLRSAVRITLGWLAMLAIVAMMMVVTLRHR